VTRLLLRHMLHVPRAWDRDAAEGDAAAPS
jgi:hypothetical protein